MFICNFKINGKKIWKTTLTLLIILIILLMIFVIMKILNSTKNSVDSTNLEKSDMLEINSGSYTNFLKDCHENINNYIGKNVKITGYVYRLPDFNSNQFVIARTMIIDSNNQAVVVGMLAQYNSASKYDSGCWIEATGCIKKGNYNGEIPIIEISDIKTIKAPNDEFVYLPTD